MTNETPVVKLGDVRQWLREGDRFALENGTVCALARVPSPSAMNRVYATYGNTGGLLCNDEPVRLISPRWERVNIGDTMPTGTVVTNGHAVWETSGTLIGGTSYRLVRTRLATRKDVRKGMRVKGKRKDDGSTYEGLVTYVGAGGFTVDAAFTISLTTNCPDLPVEILAEAPEQGEHRVELTLASGPTVTGQLSVATPGTLLSAESREALEEFAAMTYEERQREYVVQPGRRHGKTAEQQARRDALEAAYGGQPTSPFSLDPGMTISPAAKPLVEELGSVTWTGKDPKSRVEIPIRDPHAAAWAESMREQFRFIADRVDWELVATVCEMRRAAGLSASVLRNYADSTFERACSNGNGWSSMSAGAGSGMLVVLQPENTNRPIELYLEALNAAAYHAKCEELWPRKVEEPVGYTAACEGCHAPMWKGGATQCSYTSHGLCVECVTSDPRFSGEAKMDAPTATLSDAFPLTPSARYHLNDDADAFGIPEHS